MKAFGGWTLDSFTKSARSSIGLIMPAAGGPHPGSRFAVTNRKSWGDCTGFLFQEKSSGMRLVPGVEFISD